MSKKFLVLIIIVLLVFIGYLLLNGQNCQIEEKVLEKQAEEKVISMSSYSNEYYGFSLNFPKGLGYCLSDFCIEQNVPDEDIQYFKITSYDFLKYKNIEIKNDTLTYPFLEIRPRKNALNMSAVDFAKRSLELNREYRPDREYYQEEEITFAGNSAYTFIAEEGFEERGGSSTDNGLKSSSDFFERAGEGYLLRAPHRIIYFDHNDFIYRIIYPIENEVAKNIIDSFRFID